MTNYICINGKKAELTEEQMKALGIELHKASPFNRVEVDKYFYYVGSNGETCITRETNNGFDDKCFNIANYCPDKAIMEQRALHEILTRLLWRYSMENDGDKIDWSSGGRQRKFKIVCSEYNKFGVSWIYDVKNIGAVHFISQQVAENAIKEIIEPFMKAHPEFKW